MSKIILIGGTPRCGKTTLAQKISRELSIPWISTDALESIVHQYTPKDQESALFPKSVLRQKTHKSNDELYETFSIEEIIDAYSAQAETAHKAITSLIEYALKEDWDYVIEGYHITPKLLASLPDNLSSIILVSTDAKEAIKRSVSSGVENDWVRDQTTNEITLEKVAVMISAYSRKLIKTSEKHNIKVVDVSSNFEQRTNEVFDYLTK